MSQISFTGDYAEDFATWSEFYDSDPDVEQITGYGLEDRTVLEPGAGTGRLAFRLAPETDTYIASDIDDRLMQYCREEADGRDTDDLFFLTQDSLRMGLPDDSVDTIVDSWAFSSYPSPEKGAQEYDRVLADDGEIMVLREVGDSEYEQVLQEFVPQDREYDIEAEVDVALAERFGEPVEKDIIESGYDFASVDDAVEAFRFHLEGWSNIDLSADQKDELYSMMEERESDDGTVRIGEKARFIRFSR